MSTHALLMILKVKFIAKKENNNSDDRVGGKGGWVGRKKAGKIVRVIDGEDEREKGVG